MKAVEMNAKKLICTVIVHWFLYSMPVEI